MFRYKFKNLETLHFFRGTGKCPNEDEKDCIVIKMQMKPGDETLDDMITQFEAGKFLDKRYFILSQQMVRDNQDIYFCYESFDHNLQTLMAAMINGDVFKDEWKKDNVEQHRNALYDMLNTVWHGFAHIVYE
ncbi:hypothetical protein PIB30_001998, partial [Stylosanthes scabra]|nr:hypothetical protein [Stylosanthes scabra]